MARKVAVSVPVPQQQQVPTGSPRPTRHFLRNLIVGILIIGGVILLAVALVGIFSNKSASVVPPEQQTQIGPASVENPPEQTGPEVTALARQMLQVAWSEPFLTHWENGIALDLPPTMGGLYSGTTLPYCRTDVKCVAIIQSIWPEEFTEEKLANPLFGFTPNFARDPSYPEVVFAGVVIIDGRLAQPALDRGEKPSAEEPILLYHKLALSVDGMASWYPVLLFPGVEPGMPGLRVTKKEGTIVLLGRDSSFVAPMWRKATLAIDSLP